MLDTFGVPFVRVVLVEMLILVAMREDERHVLRRKVLNGLLAHA